MALTIVMYHYVRELGESRFPKIKGLETTKFREQLDYLQQHYSVITPKTLTDVVRGDAALPPKAALLTFDDGYIDHYTNVFPILHDRGLKGAFFVPGKTVLESKVLLVNKIHFTLASVSDTGQLVHDLEGLIKEQPKEFGLEAVSAYREQYYRPSRFDSTETAYVKSMLQKGLPKACREKFAGILFTKYISEDEASFSAELYMSIKQIKSMQDAGKYIGNHGYDHFWYDRLTPAEQEADIDASLGFLRQIGTPSKDWIMCYPYGNYDETLLDLLRRRGCSVGLTTRVGIARPGKDDSLLLPRLDTNDLPKDGNAQPNTWTAQA